MPDDLADFPRTALLVLPAGLMGALAGIWIDRIARAYSYLLPGTHDVDGRLLGRAVLCATGLVGGAGRRHALASAAGAGTDRGHDGAMWVCAFLLAATTATLAASLHSGSGFYTAAACTAAAMGLLLTCIDARCGLLPDALTLPLLWAGLMVSWLGHGAPLHDAVAGAVLGYALPYSLMLVFRAATGRQAFGLGDAKLLAAIGAWSGWRPLPLILLVACLMGIVWAMCHQKSLRPRGAYPFGPSLAAAAACVLLAGSELHSKF